MRPKQPQLDTAYRRLGEWADWYGRLHETSCLSYPSRTAEAWMQEDGGARSGQPKGSRAPLVDTSSHLTAVDRAVKDLPEEWQPALFAELFPANQGEPRSPEALYRHRTGRSGNRFRVERDLALAWVASRLV